MENVPKPEATGNTKAVARSRHWVFTSFEEKPPKLIEGQVTYIGYAQETCPKTGKKHWQGVIQFKNQKTLSAAKKYVGNAHLEVQRGTTEEAKGYCQKEGKYIEEGVPTKQGQDRRLVEAAQFALKGEAKKIDTDIYIRFHKGIKALVELHTEPTYRPQLKVVLLWGESGVGKSYTAYRLAPLAYRKPNGNWFDGYMQEKVAVLDEFDYVAQEPTCILQWLDPYPLRVPIKGGFTPWNPEIIVITCVKHPQAWTFKCDRNYSLEITRRCTSIIEITRENRDTITL